MSPLEVFGMLVSCGLVGGVVAWLSDTVTQQDGTIVVPRSFSSFLAYTLASTLAAFVVPLFLRLADSGLLDRVLNIGQEGRRPSDPWVLCGFALIAAFGSKAFIQGVSTRVLAMAEAANHTAKEARTKAEESRVVAEESSDRSVNTEELLENLEDAPTELTESAAAQPPTDRTSTLSHLTDPEREVIDALVNPQFTRRTASGVAKDVKIATKTVRAILDKFVELGLVEKTISAKSGNQLYRRLW